MPFSPLDALMQISTPSRPAEPPARSDGPRAFAPALEQAYQAESPRAPSASQPEQKPKAEDPAASGERQESEQSADEASVAADGAEQVKESQEQSNQDSEEAERDDEVEISAEAAAVVGVVQEAKSVEQQVIVTADDADEVDENAVKQVDPKAAIEGDQKQAEASAAAAATNDLEAAGTDAEGEPSNGQSADPVIAALNSARSRKSDDAVKEETPAAANAADAQAALEQAEEVVAETPVETKGESRERVAADDATAKKDDAREAAPKTDAQVVNEVAAVAVTNGSEQIESSTADVAGAPSAPAAVDAAPPASDAAPRAAGAIERLMAGHSLKSPKETGEPNGMPTVDRARFVQRVEGAMKTAHQRDGKIQVRLSPPDLGSVKIELAVQNGVLSAKLEAETPAARNLLLDSLPALRERLAQQDIRVEKFDVDVRDQGGSANSGQTDDRAADQSNDRRNGRSRPTAERQAAAPSAPARSLAGVSSAAAGLDVRV